MRSCAAALTKEDLADLINVAIEELIRNRSELPGFTTLFKEAQRVRANCLIFHNVQAQTRVLHQLADERHEFDEAILSRLSPYLTEHVNRIGKYTLNLDRINAAPDSTLSPRAVSRSVLASTSL